MGRRRRHPPTPVVWQVGALVARGQTPVRPRTPQQAAVTIPTAVIIDASVILTTHPCSHTNRCGTQPEHPDFYCQACASSNQLDSTQNPNPTFRTDPRTHCSCSAGFLGERLQEGEVCCIGGAHTAFGTCSRNSMLEIDWLPMVSRVMQGSTAVLSIILYFEYRGSFSNRTPSAAVE